MKGRLSAHIAENTIKAHRKAGVWGLAWDVVGKQGCLSPFLCFSPRVSYGFCIFPEKEGPGQTGVLPTTFDSVLLGKDQ